MNKFEIYRPNLQNSEVTIENYNLVYTGEVKNSLSIDNILFSLALELPAELNNKPLAKGDVVVHYKNEMAYTYLIDVNVKTKKLDNFLDSNIKHIQSKYKENINKVNELYSDAINALKTNFSDNILKTLKAFSRLYNYSYKNCIIIDKQQPEAKYLLSFNDWKSLHNARINKGEKAINLFVYAEKKITTTEPIYKDGEILLDTEGKPMFETKEDVKGSYTVGSMFDISQVTCNYYPDNLYQTVDTDILVNAVENTLGDGEVISALQTGNNDLQQIITNMVNNLIDIKYRSTNQQEQAINNCTKYVVLNALNLPYDERLIYQCKNILAPKIEANLKQIKLNSRLILKAISSSLSLNHLPMLDYINIDKDNRFNQAQIKAIQNAVSAGLPPEDIAVFAQPHYEAATMMVAINAYNAGLNRQQVNSIMSYTPQQMQELIKALINPKATVYNKLFIKNKAFNKKEMEQVNRAIDLMAAPEEMQVLISGKFDWTNMYEIVNGIELKLPIEQLKIIANENLTSAQMCQVRRGFEEGLSVDEVKSYIRQELDSFDMARQIEVIKSLKEKGIKDIQVNSLNYLVEDAKRTINDNKQQLIPDV